METGLRRCFWPCAALNCSLQPAEREGSTFAKATVDRCAERFAWRTAKIPRRRPIPIFQTDSYAPRQGIAQVNTTGGSIENNRWPAKFSMLGTAKYFEQDKSQHVSGHRIQQMMLMGEDG